MVVRIPDVPEPHWNVPEPHWNVLVERRVVGLEQEHGIADVDEDEDDAEKEPCEVFFAAQSLA